MNNKHSTADGVRELAYMTVRRFGALWTAVLRLRLRWIAFFGLAMRLFLMPLASETYDVSVWFMSSNDMLRGLGIYSSHTYTYPPLWGVTFLPFIRFLAIMMNPVGLGQVPDSFATQGIPPGILQPIVSPIFLTLLKLPLLGADLVGGYFIYKIVTEFARPERGKAALALWLLSPSIIWTSFGHGQFDIMPAVLTLFAVYLFYRKQMISSGFSLSLAILYKLYPLFFVPLYLAGLVAARRREIAWKNNLTRFLTGLTAPVIIFIVIPLLLPTREGSFLDVLGSRGGLLSSFGGFSAFGMLNLPALYNLRQSLVLNSSLANTLILAAQLMLSTVVAWRVRHLLIQDLSSGLLYGQVIILAIIFLTSPVTNPQYIVWILPFLTLLYGIKGQFFKRSWLLSLAGFFFNLIWLGPGYFFYPSAVFLGAPSLSALVSLNSAVTAISLPAITLCQFAGFGGTIACLKPGLAGFLKRHSVPPPRNSPHQIVLNPKLPNQMHTVIMFTLIFLIASLGFIAVNSQPTITASPAITITDYTIAHNSTSLQAQARLHLTGGNFPSEIDALLAPLKSAPNRPPVFIYYDPAYPTSLIDLRGWKGITDHLPLELEQRKYPSNVTFVNAQQLVQLLTTDIGDVIVIPSGTLPSTTNVTALKSFLVKGGTLFWLGDRIGYYLTGPSLSLDRNPALNPGYKAQLQLFSGIIVQTNASVLDYSIGQRYVLYSAGTQTTNLSRAFNLNYPETTVGADITNVTKLGGTVLGRINPQTNQTSLAMIPVGNGRLILFGGGVTSQFATSGETTIAADIAQMLAGSLLSSSFEVAFLPILLTPGESLNVTLALSLRTSETIYGILFVAYSPYPDINFFTQAIYPP